MLAMIRECGGKMHVREGEYEKAYADFFEAFKNYDEAGSPKRTQCLKFLVLTVMLRESQIDPFESPELKAYAQNSQLIGFLKLFNAYKSSDIKSFEYVLQNYWSDIMDDPFIEDQMEDLVRGLRCTAVLNYIKPQKSISLAELSSELCIPEDELENILLVLIEDKRATGKLSLASQGNRFVWRSHETLTKEGILNDQGQTKRYQTLEMWSERLNNVILNLEHKIH